MDTQAIKQSLLKKFSEVTADRLQKIQLAVIQLEKSDNDLAADNVARELHTMKGEARMLGLAAIGQLSHAAEDLLKAAREKKAPSRTAADLLLRVCDLVSDLVEDLESAHQGNEAVAMMCRTLADASGCEVPALNVAKSVALSDRPPVRSPGETPKPRDQDRTIRVNVEMLDTLGLVTGDLLVESARAKLRAAELNGILHRFSRVGDRLLRHGEALASASGERRLLEQLENGTTRFASSDETRMGRTSFTETSVSSPIRSRKRGWFRCPRCSKRSPERCATSPASRAKAWISRWRTSIWALTARW